MKREDYKQFMADQNAIIEKRRHLKKILRNDG